MGCPFIFPQGSATLVKDLLVPLQVLHPRELSGSVLQSAWKRTWPVLGVRVYVLKEQTFALFMPHTSPKRKTALS